MTGLFSAACVDFGTEGAGLELHPIGRSKMDKIPRSYDRGLVISTIDLSTTVP
jgi:hypothetical protein